MNFAEAWALLLDGKRIRRASWDRGFYWYRNDDAFWLHNPDEPGYPTREGRLTGEIDIDDAIATDWEEQ